jgi:hypothetical protein
MTVALVDAITEDINIVADGKMAARMVSLKKPKSIKLNPLGTLVTYEVRHTFGN